MKPSKDIKSKIKENFREIGVSVSLPKDVLATKILASNSTNFSSFLKFLITYFCRHPRRIIEKLLESDGEGINIVISNLLKESGLSNLSDSKKSIKVWKGTVGEVIATAYVLGFTDYAVPVFKLRFAPNRRLAMHGDDLLGFRFKEMGKPASLLVGEAKNWENPKEALKAANATLLRVKDSSPTLLNFIIEELDAQGRHQEAIMAQRFLDEYNYSYMTEYLAFVVSDNNKWNDEYFKCVSSNPAIPLKISVSLVSEVIQTSLILQEDEEEKYVGLPIDDIDEVEDSNKLLNNIYFKNEYSQLASASLASELQVQDRESIHYKLNPVKLEKAACLLTYSGIRPSEDSEENKERLLYEAARIFERLSIWNLEYRDKSRAISSIINSAITYSIAGYSANAKVLY